MPLNLQAKILRAIEEKTITRVGETDPIATDFRIIAATNHDIVKLIEEKKFRLDLLHRLNTIHIHIPPLRDRIEDIEPLLTHYTNEFARKLNKPVPSIEREAINALLNYSFPGNVRELENTIERAVVLTEGDIIQANDLVHLCNANRTLPTQNKKLGHLAEVEKEHIMQVLKMLNDNKTKTAQFLGIDRKTLQRKMTKYGLFDSKD